MAKIPQEISFFNTKKHLVRTLGPYEAILLAYVAEWEAKNLLCFASRKHISEETGFSEKTIQNLIKKLADAGYLTVSHNGRKRVISLTSKGGISYPQRGYKILSEGVRDTQMRGYEILTTNKEITNKDITKNELLSDDVNLNAVQDEDAMKKEDEEKLEARLSQLKAESEGWDDKGTHFEKWDAETRTVLRKKKPVHQERRWNYDDVPE